MDSYGEDLSLPALMDKASRVAGHDDWGDPSFTGTVELLLSSCRSTARLNSLGARVLRSVVVRHLVNRLWLGAYASAHPDTASRSVGAAIVVTGLPRTGTTLLHNLLALDPGCRVLRFWEALHPVPPDPAEGPTEAQLVEQAATWLERLYELVPRFRTIHAATPEGPEECDALLQNDFASQHFDDMFSAEAYSEWLATASLGGEYASYAAQLCVLAGPEPAFSHWVLKSPSHLGHLDALLEACPESTVVHCHRDPVESIPSYASLVLTLRSAYSDHASAATVGRHALDRCRTAMDRALDARRAVPGSIVDVSYPALVKDPVSALRGLYEQVARPWPDDFEGRISRWVADHPQHHHGVHRYDLDTFGLTAEAVGTAFGGYLEQFPHLV